jgi:hypothetical protein
MKERNCLGRGEREDAMPWWGYFGKFWSTASEGLWLGTYLSYARRRTRGACSFSHLGYCLTAVWHDLREVLEPDSRGR